MCLLLTEFNAQKFNIIPLVSSDQRELAAAEEQAPGATFTRAKSNLCCKCVGLRTSIQTQTRVQKNSDADFKARSALRLSLRVRVKLLREPQLSDQRVSGTQQNTDSLKGNDVTGHV